MATKMTTSTPEIIRLADALYKDRGNLESVRRSVEILEASAAKNYESAWRLARSHFFLGQETSEINEARREHRRGIAIARRAAELGTARVEGHFWLGVNLAMLAAHEPFYLALPHALSARRSLQRAVKISHGFHGAGPLRVLARLEQKLPRIFGGGPSRARANFEKAVRIAPNNTVTRIYFAELLLEIGDHAAARAQLEAILNICRDEEWAYEIARDTALAREILRNKFNAH
jgi:hypothetical protein